MPANDQYASSGISLTIIPAWTEESARHPAMESADTVVLLKTYRHREKIIKLLEERGMTSNVLYASRVGLKGEFITDNLREADASPKEYLSMIVVKRNNCELSAPSGRTPSPIRGEDQGEGQIQSPKRSG